MSYDENLLIGEYICLHRFYLRESSNSKSKKCGFCDLTDMLVITKYHINEYNEEWIKCDKGWFNINHLKTSQQRRIQSQQKKLKTYPKYSDYYNKILDNITLINSEYNGIKRYLGYINPIFKSKIEKISKDIQDIQDHILEVPRVGLCPLALLAFKEGSNTLINNRLTEQWIM